MTRKRFSNTRDQEDIKRLLACAPLIRSACELDLLVFLYRHPRVLLTTRQLAVFVGHKEKQVASALDVFISTGLLERTQNPMHSADMYVLSLDGPQGGGIKTLVERASTRHGRRELLQQRDGGQSATSFDIAKQTRKLHATA